MPEYTSGSSFVSLRTFKSLHDQYFDFCRKLKFFIKGGFTIQEESLALEIISELLDQKEKDLETLMRRASEEGPDADTDSESMEVLLGRSLMQHEDYPILQRLAAIRRDGGSRWEALQAIIWDTDHVSRKQ